MGMREKIDEFLGGKRLAIVGVSRSGKKFGRKVYEDLDRKGYDVVPVNPAVSDIEGKTCFPSLTAVPGSLDGAVLVVPPGVTEKVVRDAAGAGVPRIWMQQGSESEEAIRFCREKGIDVVHGHCVMMFSEPVGSIHRFHRWIWKILGKLPD